MSDNFTIKVLLEGFAGTGAGGAGGKSQYNQAEQSLRAFQRKQIQIEREGLRVMGKDNENYWTQKEQLRNREIGLMKNLSAQQKEVLRKQASDSLAIEKDRYQKSVDLATKLQETLKSVFQRAVFYTAVYKGVSMVTGAFKNWIDVNVELDFALAKVNTISEVTVTQFAKLQDMSLLSGKGIVDLAGALYEINSANIKGADAMRVLEVANRAAVGGFVDAEAAADTLVDVLNSYKLATSQTEMVSDKLLKSVEIGKVKWEEMHGVLGRILPVAYEVGVPLDELFGTLSALTLGGLKFNEAVVGLRQIFMKIMKPTIGLDKALVSLNNEWQTNYSSMQKVVQSKGIIATLQALEKVVDDGDAEMAEMFTNVRGLTAALNLLGDSGKRAEDIIAEIAQSTGTTNEKFDIMADTIKGAKDRMSAMWVALGNDLFTFGDSFKGVINQLTRFLSVLREIAPILKGLMSSITVLAGALALVGMRWLAINYIMPLLYGQFMKIKSLFVATRVQATLTGLAIERVGQASASASVGVGMLSAAFSAFTLLAMVAVGVWTAFRSWQEKTRIEAERVAEATDNMNKMFIQSRMQADLLSQTRPFAGMDVKDLTAQVERNNEQLERRKQILKELSLAERNIGIDYDDYGKAFETEIGSDESISRTELNKELKKIEGTNGVNLEVMRELNKEYSNKVLNLKDARVAVLDIANGFKLTKTNIEGMKTADLGELALELQKQKESIEERLGGINVFAPEMMGKNQAEILKQKDAVEVALKTVNDSLTEIEIEANKKRLEEDKKAQAKRLKQLDKYYEAYMQRTVEGRVKLLEAEREYALKEAAVTIGLKAEDARDMAKVMNLLTKKGQTELLYINTFYDDKIAEEKKKHYAEMNKEAEEYNKKVIESATKRAKIEAQLSKWRKDSDKEMNDFLAKSLDERDRLVDTYLKSEIDKIEEKYKKERDAAIANAANRDELSAMLSAIEIQREKELTDARLEEWEKQNAILTSLFDVIGQASTNTLNLIFDRTTIL
jgi:TP901 family phage tail tape measure protein